MSTSNEPSRAAGLGGWAMCSSLIAQTGQSGADRPGRLGRVASPCPPQPQQRASVRSRPAPKEQLVHGDIARRLRVRREDPQNRVAPRRVELAEQSHLKAGHHGRETEAAMRRRDGCGELNSRDSSRLVPDVDDSSRSLESCRPSCSAPVHVHGHASAGYVRRIAIRAFSFSSLGSALRRLPLVMPRPVILADQARGDGSLRRVSAG